MPGMKNEAAGDGAESLGIDSIYDVETIDRIELNQHRRHGLYVFELAQFVANGDRHRRAAERHENRSGRRLDHDVRADAFGSLRGFEEQSAGESDDDDNEGDFDGDREHGDESAERPVHHVLRNHVADQG